MEACELALYALLWLDSVAFAVPPHLRAARCVELLDPVAWQRVEARRSEAIPMAALVAAAKHANDDGVFGSGSGSGSVHGSGAMAVLGPVVYAWAQYERLLHGMSPSWSASWRNAELTPRQLFLYLQACISPGKRGERLRAGRGATGGGAGRRAGVAAVGRGAVGRGVGGAGSTAAVLSTPCRWEVPAVAVQWKQMIFGMPTLRHNLVALLGMPLHEAQHHAFERRTREIVEIAESPLHEAQRHAVARHQHHQQQH